MNNFSDNKGLCQNQVQVDYSKTYRLASPCSPEGRNLPGRPGGSTSASGWGSLPAAAPAGCGSA